jgi:hypothetical protein
MGLHNLEKIFKPRSAAIIGASEKTRTIGWAILKNMKEARFDGSICAAMLDLSFKEDWGPSSYKSVSRWPGITGSRLFKGGSSRKTTRCLGWLKNSPLNCHGVERPTSAWSECVFLFPSFPGSTGESRLLIER